MSKVAIPFKSGLSLSYLKKKFTDLLNERSQSLLNQGYLYHGKNSM